MIFFLGGEPGLLDCGFNALIGQQAIALVADLGEP